MPDFEFFFLFWNVLKVKVDFIVIIKIATLIAKIVYTKKHINTSLNDLFIAFNNHGWHGFLSFSNILPILDLHNLELEANKLYDRAKKLYKAALLTRCYVMLILILILRSTINDILRKFHSLIKVWSLLIYIVSLGIIQ